MALGKGHYVARVEEPAPDTIEPELLRLIEALARAHVDEDYATAHRDRPVAGRT
jgi:hypothetical protein